MGWRGAIIIVIIFIIIIMIITIVMVMIIIILVLQIAGLIGVTGREQEDLKRCQEAIQLTWLLVHGWKMMILSSVGSKIWDGLCISYFVYHMLYFTFCIWYLKFHILIFRAERNWGGAEGEGLIVSVVAHMGPMPYTTIPYHTVWFNHTIPYHTVWFDLIPYHTMGPHMGPRLGALAYPAQPAVINSL